MKDVVYFPHDANATFDSKMLELRGEYGYEGLGMFWAIVEQIRMNGDECRYKKDSIKGMSLALNIEREKLKTIIEYCCEIGLFTCDAEYIWSKRMVEDYEWMKSKSSKSKAAAKSRWEKQSDDIQDVNASAMQTQCERITDAMPIKDSIVKNKKEKESNKSAKAVSSIQSFLNDLTDIERSLCERFINHRKLIKEPIVSHVALKTFLKQLKEKSTDPAVWLKIMDAFEEQEWQSVKWIKLEDIPSTEPIPLGYRLAAMRCGAKTDDQIRKIIPKFEGLNPDFVGLWFWHNKVVPDAENIRTLPNWIRDMKVEKNEIRKVYAKHKAEGVRAILEKSIEWTKTKI